MDRDKLLAIANQLSNEEICTLIDMVSNRLTVLYGCLNNHVISSEVEFACMNGPYIQINCTTANLDDLSQDDFIRSALESNPPPEQETH